MFVFINVSSSIIICMFVFVFVSVCARVRLPLCVATACKADAAEPPPPAPPQLLSLRPRESPSCAPWHYPPPTQVSLASPEALGFCPAPVPAPAPFPPALSCFGGQGRLFTCRGRPNPLRPWCNHFSLHFVFLSPSLPDKTPSSCTQRPARAHEIPALPESGSGIGAVCISVRSAIWSKHFDISNMPTYRCLEQPRPE